MANMRTEHCLFYGMGLHLNLGLNLFTVNVFPEAPGS